MSFERYKKDIEQLVEVADLLRIAMTFEQFPEQKTRFQERLEAKGAKMKEIPSFPTAYQPWYSEALVCINQLLPDRLEDFKSYYSPAKTRKNITYENYTISDYLKGLSITVDRGFETKKLVDPSAAIPAFDQQCNIVKSLNRRFESALFDIRTLVQADLFENELDEAYELSKKGFHRGSGAIAGVVLEGHLRTVCNLRKLSVPKIAPLAKLNDLLKGGDTIDIPTWRFIQHLTDLRNLCDHKLDRDPTAHDIKELIEGVRKITKTVF